MVTCMGDVVNLNRFRKARERAAEQREAAANRRRHGRDKAEKARDQIERANHSDKLDQHLLEDGPAPKPPHD